MGENDERAVLRDTITVLESIHYSRCSVDGSSIKRRVAKVSLIRNCLRQMCSLVVIHRDNL